MKLDCKHIWRELSNYLDGEISAELRAEVEKAKGFVPLLSRFILATTAPRDEGIQ